MKIQLVSLIQTRTSLFLVLIPLLWGSVAQASDQVKAQLQFETQLQQALYQGSFIFLFSKQQVTEAIEIQTDYPNPRGDLSMQFKIKKVFHQGVQLVVNVNQDQSALSDAFKAFSYQRDLFIPWNKKVVLASYHNQNGKKMPLFSVKMKGNKKKLHLLPQLVKAPGPA